MQSGGTDFLLDCREQSPRWCGDRWPALSLREDKQKHLKKMNESGPAGDCQDSGTIIGDYLEEDHGPLIQRFFLTVRWLI
ncbi:MAG: hypothetical protein AMS22_10965 [Thiotrichales bacterium SG8_50]|nr:MAG: hypothetical protein AMS22_10965 [Thiotrichales bacterium SG8_50]